MATLQQRLEWKTELMEEKEKAIAFYSPVYDQKLHAAIDRKVTVLTRDWFAPILDEVSLDIKVEDGYAWVKLTYSTVDGELSIEMFDHSELTWPSKQQYLNNIEPGMDEPYNVEWATPDQLHIRTIAIDDRPIFMNSRNEFTTFRELSHSFELAREPDEMLSQVVNIVWHWERHGESDLASGFSRYERDTSLRQNLSRMQSLVLGDRTIWAMDGIHLGDAITEDEFNDLLPFVQHSLSQEIYSPNDLRTYSKERTSFRDGDLSGHVERIGYAINAPANTFAILHRVTVIGDRKCDVMHYAEYCLLSPPLVDFNQNEPTEFEFF